ncbi:NAD(P)-dependent dehydrogenase (short-subunit alcohol dehydrogenase family) [Amycolatopsis bartoniae]|uniref:Short-chain dehydrogenase/reductase n=1 Tax=Amycolatopsis bartoniae TaxID=941986 RepID=A0A8H9IY79_9PSEU|nr:SDR family NAD(P)-dependent oxidoreductase [Amycolatopsis bartoniae]MBB2936520.1 NAD(P)-dependent dehydrogenase (short-subunit alcohol dehydrogenase family) [Amycolatopsis bartoniae]TVT11004.1 SDR family NAD(P)-dependent oxidoreductase [Amycolatopsis bartoniae]GHF68345.1 short-chain dehydrogenase/reductase [Amycolatopsis bartoniae]
MSTWFITGAGRGLGADIARAALAGGDNVAVAVRDPARLPADLRNSDRVFAVALDVTRTGDIPAAVRSVVERFGGIDVLVNNAGRGLLGALEEVTDAEARSLFDLNVFGLINVTRAVLPVMRARGGGKLVHIGSRSGFEGEPGVSVYSASKFAVAGISEALSVELAPFGVQSMVVEPGVFRTDFLDRSSLSVAGHRIAAYDGTPAHATLEWAGEANHTQLGDPVKGAALIYEVACQDTLPTHLPLGRDALDRLEVKIAQRRDEVARWREKSAATAHNG